MRALNFIILETLGESVSVSLLPLIGVCKK
jgi:hypothetical protein